ncbi:STAS domain-containing protein [Pseudokineococcus marinus]|uniref:STAS domain-containing protein n=1 Tax=Pseudokineococcus marinus TaxID=351215 RepID=A0A849BSN5_9ACTN|nr:STAS domain-containing protein [Pseudokineococcus marinus]NNH23987.1 STAS domain-containing protein [Pseudokineococcus marinus]
MTAADDLPPVEPSTGGGAVVLDVGDPTLLHLRGEVDLHAVETAGPDLDAGLRRVEAVDAREVTFIDSMGLHCLITAAVAARERGTRVRLLRPSRPVVQMLEVTAMTDFFDVEA